MQAFNKPWYAIWVNECLHLQWNPNNHLKDHDYEFNDGMITLMTFVDGVNQD